MQSIRKDRTRSAEQPAAVASPYHRGMGLTHREALVRRVQHVKTDNFQSRGKSLFEQRVAAGVGRVVAETVLRMRHKSSKSVALP